MVESILTIIECPNCGADFNEDELVELAKNGFLKCIACGKTIISKEMLNNMNVLKAIQNGILEKVDLAVYTPLITPNDVNSIDSHERKREDKKKDETRQDDLQDLFSLLNPNNNKTLKVINAIAIALVIIICDVLKFFPLMKNTVPDIYTFYTLTVLFNGFGYGVCLIICDPQISKLSLFKLILSILFWMMLLHEDIYLYIDIFLNVTRFFNALPLFTASFILYHIKYVYQNRSKEK